MEVQLRPLHPDDYKFLYDLRSDTSSLHLWERPHFIPNQREFYQELDNWHRQRPDVLFVVTTKEDQPVGMAYTLRTDLIHGVTFIAGALSPEFRRKTIGTQGLLLLMDHLFKSLPIRKIYADILEYNNASLALIKRVGFHQEGCFKAHQFYAGEYWNCFRFAFFQRDWSDASSTWEAIQNSRPHQIVVVCSANRCRSVIAKAFFDAELSRLGACAGWEVKSAGLYARPGLNADHETENEMLRRGFDVRKHRSTLLTRQLVEAAHVILAMTERQLHALSNDYPEARDKVHLLNQDTDIRDWTDPDKIPIEKVANSVEAGVASWVEKLVGAQGSGSNPDQN